MTSFKTLFFAALGLVTAMSGLAASATAASGSMDLRVKPERLAEWNDWRFGLFIHWGPWSQTEVGYIWKMVLEDPPGVRERRFDLWKTFNPTQFDPKKWARAAKDAGMKYVVFIAKHHDGFNNYDTKLSGYKVTAPECPFSKAPNADLTRAVLDAFRDEGLAVGLYYSHIDWHHPDGKYFSRGHWDYDPGRIERDPASWERFADYEIGQLRELLTNYGKIDLLWFDIRWPFAGSGMERSTNERVRASVLTLLATMKELQPDLIYNDRGLDLYGGFHTPEQRVPATGFPGSWETSLTITNNRGYWFKGDGVSAKTPAELIRTLVDIASKGGNLLLNVGPRADGELAAGEYESLAGMGAWLRVNGESIYGTRRSPFLDLPWGRATTKGRRIFLHVFDWPGSGELFVPGLQTPVHKAWLLSDAQKKPLPVSAAAGGQTLTVGKDPGATGAAVIALEFASDPTVKNSLYHSAGTILELPAARATLLSAQASYNYGQNVAHGDFIENLRPPNDRVSWTITLARAEKFRVEVNYAVQQAEAGGMFRLEIDNTTFSVRTQGTADWKGSILNVPGKDKHGERDNRWVFKPFSVGEVSLAAGDHTVTIVPEKIAKSHLMYLKAVRLVPIP